MLLPRTYGLVFARHIYASSLYIPVDVAFVSEEVELGGTTITHDTAFSDTNYAIIGRCHFDEVEDNIDYLVENKLAASYDVTPAAQSIWDGMCMEDTNQTLIAADSAVVVEATGTIVSGLLFSNSSYALVIRCYSAAGNNIDYLLEDKISAGFTITPAEDGFIDFICIHETLTSGYRADAAVEVEEAGTAISFTTLGSTDYALVIRCYDADGNNVDFTVENKAEDGFTLTPAADGYIDYIAHLND